MFDINLVKKNEARFNKVTKISDSIVQNVISNINDLSKFKPKNALNISANNIDIVRLLQDKNIAVNNVKFPFNLDVTEEKFDLVTSLNILHKVNNLDVLLKQIQNKLNINGLFFGSVYGAENIIQICNSFYESYQHFDGNFINHFLPIIDVKSAGLLMQSCGFQNIVINIEKYTEKYDDIYECLQKIREIGGSNVLNNRLKKPMNRAILEKANEIFANKYDKTCEFVILYLFGEKSLE